MSLYALHKGQWPAFPWLNAVLCLHWLLLLHDLTFFPQEPREMGAIVAT